MLSSRFGLGMLGVPRMMHARAIVMWLSVVVWRRAFGALTEWLCQKTLAVSPRDAWVTSFERARMYSRSDGVVGSSLGVRTTWPACGLGEEEAIMHARDSAVWTSGVAVFVLRPFDAIVCPAARNLEIVKSSPLLSRVGVNILDVRRGNRDSIGPSVLRALGDDGGNVHFEPGEAESRSFDSFPSSP